MIPNVVTTSHPHHVLVELFVCRDVTKSFILRFHHVISILLFIFSNLYGAGTCGTYLCSHWLRMWNLSEVCTVRSSAVEALMDSLGHSINLLIMIVSGRPGKHEHNAPTTPVSTPNTANRANAVMNVSHALPRHLLPSCSTTTHTSCDHERQLNGHPTALARVQKEMREGREEGLKVGVLVSVPNPLHHLMTRAARTAATRAAEDNDGNSIVTTLVTPCQWQRVQHSLLPPRNTPPRPPLADPAHVNSSPRCCFKAKREAKHEHDEDETVCYPPRVWVHPRYEKADLRANPYPHGGYRYGYQKCPQITRGIS
jgi:hypothetical protein